MNEEALNPKKSYRKWFLYIPAFLVLIVIFIYVFILWTMPDVSVLIKSDPASTSLMEERRQQAELSDKTLKIKQYWVSFGEIPEMLKNAVRISEDAGFYFHEGIDMEELEESIKRNWEEGRFARGASTITQQLAKNLYLSTDKTVWRKIKEFFIARELEEHLSKNRIFHLYLNLIEFGPGIFGVEAASRHYFGKTVSQLSATEMIRLTGVIPRPLKARPDTNTKWLLWRCRWITGKLFLYKYIEKEDHDALMAQFTSQ